MSGEILTVEDVANILKQSDEAVRKLLSTGALPGRQIGEDWYVSHRQLVDYIEQGPTAPPARPKPSGQVIAFGNDWECASCHTKNDPEHVACKMCKAVRLTPLMGYIRRK